MDRAEERTLEVRGVQLPLLGDDQLLLPHASLSEVVGYRPPEPVTGSPAWLQGTMLWRQYRVPVVVFDQLLKAGDQKIGHRARMAICNTLNDDPARPYVAIVLQTIPRLVRVSEASLEPLVLPGDAPEMLVLGRALLNGREVWIPDLDGLEQRLAEILDQPEAG